METNQALLLTERVIFLERITNNTDLGEEQYQKVVVCNNLSIPFIS